MKRTDLFIAQQDVLVVKVEYPLKQGLKPPSEVLQNRLASAGLK